MLVVTVLRVSDQNDSKALLFSDTVGPDESTHAGGFTPTAAENLAFLTAAEAEMRLRIHKVQSLTVTLVGGRH